MKKTGLLRTWGTTQRTSWLLILVIAMIAITFVIFFYWYTSSIIEKRMVRELELRISLIKDMIQGAYQEVRSMDQDLLRFFKTDFTNLTLDENTIINVNGVPTPLLKTHDEAINLNNRIVDQFYQRTGAVSSVFIKKDNVFVRIATTLKTATGQRALGTFIGPDNPGYNDLTHGKSYIGQAELMGSQYIIDMEPMFDANGRLIAVLGIGTDFTTSYQALKEKIRSIRIGETGNAFVLDAKSGKNYGTMMIHPLQEGKNVLNATDNAGRYYIKEILERKNGNIVYVEKETSAKGTRSEKKIAVFSYFPEWQSVIVVTVYNREVTHGSLFVVAGILTFIVLVSGIAIWFKQIK